VYVDSADDQVVSVVEVVGFSSVFSSSASFFRKTLQTLIVSIHFTDSLSAI